MKLLGKIKKRNIGILLLVLLRLFTAFFPESITPEQEDTVRWAIDILLMAGAVDSIRRTDTVKKIITKNNKL